MISYAQNAEDVVLARAFRGQAWGFYVDVGANHPEWDSVTRHFYGLGWRGINVEPMPVEHRMLQAARPGDVNLQVAAGEAPGRAVLHQTPADNRGSSTLLADVAAQYAAAGQTLEQTEVEVVTLASICEQWAPATIDFLKVDVEGYELAALRGADFTRFRPRVVVVEAVQPATHEPSHAAWEPLLLDAEYGFALFDGVNRFYADLAEPDLLARMHAPANVLDGYVTLRQATERAAVHEHLAALRACADRLDQAVRPTEWTST